MNTYLLLRDNRESGPYRLEELKSMALRNLDLIWVEGKSRHWDFATEFEELKPFVVARPRSFKKSLSVSEPMTEIRSAVVTTPFESKRTHAIGDPSARMHRSAENTLPLHQPTIQFKEREITGLPDEKFSFRPTNHRSNGLWIMGLMGLLLFSAFIIKNLVDVDTKPTAAAGSSILPLPSLPEEKNPKKAADFSYQNALSKEETPMEETKTGAIKNSLNFKNIKKLVSISNNKYKVDLLGDVNDLQLNIHNGSDQTLDKINILVSFLKPNGQKIRSEEFSVYSVMPGSTKILVVPPVKTGVKVNYKISGVESKTTKVITGDI